MNRSSMKPRIEDSGKQARDGGMGLAPVYAAVLGAACCLGVPLLVALLAGGTSAAASRGGFDLLTLLIIGFALGGVLAVAISHWRASKRRRHESPEMQEPAHDKPER